METERKKEHYFLYHRKVGSAKSLKGRVLFVNIFVDEDGDVWTEDEKRKAADELNQAEIFLKSEAFKRGKYLSFQNYTIQFSVPKLPRSAVGDSYRWIFEEALLQALHARRNQDLNRRLRKEYQVDEVAAVMLVHNDNRSNAPGYSVAYINFPEFCLIFKNGLCKYTIVHEVLHLFGAADLYYPESVVHAARKHLGSSIMMDYGEMRIDPLTEFLIGWTESPSQEASAFLEETRHISADEIARAGENS